MAAISFVNIDELGLTAKDQKQDVFSWLAPYERNDALTLTGLKELKAAVAEAIEGLPEKERLVVSLYYQDELTMKEIGRVLDITESRVSQLHSKAVIHLRIFLKKRGLLD